jgi:hypothetical protein
MHFVRIWTQLNVWALGAQLRSYEDNCILGYCAVWSHVSKPTFLRYLLPASRPFIRGYYVDGSCCCCWETSNGYIILIWMTLGKLSLWRQRRKWNVGEVGCEDGTWRGLSRGCLISGMLWLIDWASEWVIMSMGWDYVSEPRPPTGLFFLMCMEDHVEMMIAEENLSGKSSETGIMQGAGIC